MTRGPRTTTRSPRLRCPPQLPHHVGAPRQSQGLTAEGTSMDEDRLRPCTSRGGGGQRRGRPLSARLLGVFPAVPVERWSRCATLLTVPVLKSCAVRWSCARLCSTHRRAPTTRSRNARSTCCWGSTRLLLANDSCCGPAWFPCPRVLVALTGDDRGAHRTCTYCGCTKRIRSLGPPEAHDMSGIRR